MIQIYAGAKGTGKSKKLIGLANEYAKEPNGTAVFIDDDRSQMHSLQRAIRFVDTGEYPISHYREFIGFICGILAQDGDIEYIYIDGLSNIIKNFNNEELVKLIYKLEKLTTDAGVNFIMTINDLPENLPAEAKKYVTE